jgi:hypothetical protein
MNLTFLSFRVFFQRPVNVRLYNIRVFHLGYSRLPSCLKKTRANRGLRRLGTRGEAAPAGWSLHRTGMLPGVCVGLLDFPIRRN